MSEDEGWEPFPEHYGQTKSVSFHADDRVAYRLKVAGICMDFSTQLILECLVLSFLGEFDKRVAGTPSDEPLMVPFPWPPFGMDSGEFKKHIRKIAEDAAAEIAEKGMPPLSHFQRYAEAHANATPTAHTRSKKVPRKSEAGQEDARDAGRKWALGVKDIDKATWVLMLEEKVGSSNFPSFLEGVREVVDAFERWDKRKQG
jgi:hypothetical protein